VGRLFAFLHLAAVAMPVHWLAASSPRHKCRGPTRPHPEPSATSHLSWKVNGGGLTGKPQSEKHVSRLLTPVGCGWPSGPAFSLRDNPVYCVEWSRATADARLC
jgi:hypothetical protein